MKRSNKMKLRNGWIEGKINGFDYQAKVYAEGSRFGIHGGKISKLWMHKNGKTIVNYDRGWDVGEDKRDVWEPVVDLLDVQRRYAHDPKNE